MAHSNGRPVRATGDLTAVIVALAAVAGARAAVPTRWAPGLIGCAVIGGLVSIVVRRPWLAVVTVLVATAGLAARAEAGLGGVPERFSGQVQLIRVLDDRFVGVTAQVRAGAHQLELIPPEQSRRLLDDAEAGDRFEVTGAVDPVEPATARQRGTHVAGRLRATRVAPGAEPGLLWRVVGSVRGAVRAAAAPLPDTQRGLFEGFVLGDASAQTDLQRADFRASGLTHLFVASGEHVAFVLVLFAPVLSRVGSRTRWALTVLVCVLYALVTGLQPSVLRAATMAVVATTAAGLGRPVRSWRSLAYAVTLLVLADPFLVHSTAFGLSVGACAGIVALARPLTGALIGPVWLRRPFAVTIAAQIGAAPLLLGFAGGMPVAAVFANVLAVPPAGGIMILGVPALAVAATGLPGTGALVWIPRLLLGWVEGVAQVAAALPLGHLGGIAVLVAVAGLVLALGARGAHGVRLRRSGYLVAVAALFSPVLLGSVPPPHEDGPVIVRRGSTTVVVLTGSQTTDRLLTSLSVARVRDLDAVVVPRGDTTDRRMLDTIGHRHRIGQVVTPTAISGVDLDQVVPDEGEHVEVHAVTLRVIATDPVLSVYAEPP